MLSHAIFGTDFSPAWEQAIARLPAMVELLGIERLTLVHSVETHRFKFKREEEVSGLSEERLEEWRERLGEMIDIPIDVKVSEGLPATTLLDIAAQLDADLIIAANGSHSRSSNFLLGNVALNLARMTARPLLILPWDSAINDGGPVLLATDGSEAVRGAETLFTRLAERGASGLVTCINREGEQHTDMASVHAQSLAEKWDKIQFRDVTGHPDEAITRLATDEKASLIVIGKRGHHSMRELVLGSTAEAVCRQAAQPVLLVPQTVR